MVRTDGGDSRWNRRTALYRLYDEHGQLLYIGISFNPHTRWYQHAGKSPWWGEVVRKEFCWLPTRREAEEAEQAAIFTERPRYNIRDSDDPNRRLPVPSKPQRRPNPSPNLVRMMAEITAAARAAVRAEKAVKRSRNQLYNGIFEASQRGVGPAAIAREIDHLYTRGHIGQIIIKMRQAHTSTSSAEDG